MKISQFKKSIFASACISLTLLSGCTTTNPYTGQQQTSDASIGTGLGALGGAAIGVVAGGGRGALIGGALGALTGGLVGNSMDKENAELRNMLVGTGVQVVQNGNAIQLIMASDVTFNTNQSAVKAGFYPVLNSVAVVLRKYDRNSITVTGYTDSVGNPSYNQVLSERRAASVGSYLAAQGIAPNRIYTNGMGMRYPIASNATASGRSMNRRVVITLR